MLWPKEDLEAISWREGPTTARGARTTMLRWTSMPAIAYAHTGTPQKRSRRATSRPGRDRGRCVALQWSHRGAAIDTTRGLTGSKDDEAGHDRGDGGAQEEDGGAVVRGVVHRQPADRLQVAGADRVSIRVCMRFWHWGTVPAGGRGRAAAGRRGSAPRRSLQSRGCLRTQRSPR